MKSTIHSRTGQYVAVGAQTGVMSASPHQLIEMLLEGAISKIAMAKGAMQREQIEQKGELITKASSIIMGLRSSLDMEAGGEVAQNLDELYGYMAQRLLDAHINNEISALDEVSNLLREIKHGWDAIANQNSDKKPVFEVANSE